jgi:hypothetical protein
MPDHRPTPNVLVELMDMRQNLDRLAMYQIRERLDHMISVVRGGKPPDDPANQPHRTNLEPLNYSGSPNKGMGNPWGAAVGANSFKPRFNQNGEVVGEEEGPEDDGGEEGGTKGGVMSQGKQKKNLWAQLKEKEGKDSGVLSFSNKKTHWFPKAIGARKEILKEIFEMFDEDENGTINLDELAMVYKHFGV